MRVILTDEAKKNLKSIGDFIHSHNSRRAMSFVEELLARCKELGSMPKAYPLVPRYERFGVRRRVYRDYLIFYRIRKNLVEVIFITQGAQEYETLLFPNGG